MHTREARSTIQENFDVNRLKIKSNTLRRFEVTENF